MTRVSHGVHMHVLVSSTGIAARSTVREAMDHVPLEDLRKLVAAATCSWDRDLRERTWLIIEQLLDGDSAEDLGLALAAWLQDCAA